MKRTLLVLTALFLALPLYGQATTPYATRIRNTTFAALGAPTAGNVRYCTDCTATNPCGGGGTGAFADRVGAAWNCATSGGGAPGYPLLAPDGTAAAPSYSFINNSNMGLFRSANNLIGIAVSGVEQWDFSATCFCPFTNNTEDIGNGSVNPRDVNAARNVNAAGIVSSGDGSVSSASFQFASQAGLGFYKRGASSVGVTTGSNIGWFDTTGYHAFGTVVEAFNDIGVTSTDGVVLTTNGAAAAGAQDWSPRLRFTGSGWRTDATAEAQAVDWIAENQPIQGTASPSSNLVFSSQINAGGYIPRFTLTSAGSVGVGVTPAANIPFDMSIAGGADQYFRVVNTATTFGQILLLKAGNGTTSNREVYLELASAETTSRDWIVGMNASEHFVIRDNDGTADRLTVDATSGAVKLNTLVLTAGTATVTNSAEVRTSTHRYDWTNAMVAALPTTAGDILMATLPALTVVTNAYVRITGAAAGPATVTVACGRTSATYIDYIVASDAKAAANTIYGDASAERGTNLTGYDLPSPTGTTAINCHFISTGGNLSTVTGSTGALYLTTVLLP